MRKVYARYARTVREMPGKLFAIGGVDPHAGSERETAQCKAAEPEQEDHNGSLS
jgi:hypothetical protein